MKRRFHDPQLVVAGDFNQWKIDCALQDFADIKEVLVGNTRKNKSIDRIFISMSRAVTASGTLEPLEPETPEVGASSDHRVAYCRLLLPRLSTFKWETYSYQYFNDQSQRDF